MRNTHQTDMNLPIYSRDGADSGRTVEFDDAVFGLEPNDHAIWLDVKASEAHARQGTHKTKERAEVAFSTRKLYRQKGTGHARAGSAKSPIRKGGGTIFGPRPHAYNVGINKKTKRVARRSALAHKLRGEALRVVEDFTMEAPKTRDLAGVIQSLDLGGKVLLLTAQADEVIYRSGRNIPTLTVRRATDASTRDLMHAQTVLIQESAVGLLTEALRPSQKAQLSDDAELPVPVADEPVLPVADEPAADESAA